MDTIKYILVVHDQSWVSLVIDHSDSLTGYIMKGADYWLGVQAENDNIILEEVSIEHLIDWVQKQSHFVLITQTIFF